MNRTILHDLVVNGENSLVEFGRDDVRKEDLAKEMVALLNLEGGHVLLGVEDDGSISGLARSPAETEEWVMNIARDLVQPGFVPTWQCVKMNDNVVVGVIGLSADSPDKPYRARRRGAWTTFLRVGTISRMASREEDGRLYQIFSRDALRYTTRSRNVLGGHRCRTRSELPPRHPRKGGCSFHEGGPRLATTAGEHRRAGRRQDDIVGDGGRPAPVRSQPVSTPSPVRHFGVVLSRHREGLQHHRRGGDSRATGFAWRWQRHGRQRRDRSGSGFC